MTLEVEDVAARIAALGQRRLVVTGGEPMLQAPALAHLLALLPDVTGPCCDGPPASSSAIAVRVGPLQPCYSAALCN